MVIISIWQEENLEDKIIRILKDVKFRSNPQHHFGQPFVTPYQLAMELNKREGTTVKKLNSCKEIGGEGSGSYNSLPQYLAGQISQHYDDMRKRGSRRCFPFWRFFKGISFRRSSKIFRQRCINV